MIRTHTPKQQEIVRNPTGLIAIFRAKIRPIIQQQLKQGIKTVPDLEIALKEAILDVIPKADKFLFQIEKIGLAGPGHIFSGNLQFRYEEQFYRFVLL